MNDPLSVLALLWHSPYEFIVAGGFRRTQEILKRSPSDISLVAVDSAPSMLRGLIPDNVEVVEYRFPRALRSLDRKFFVLMRLIEWLFALVSMCVACLRLKLRGAEFDAVYVPSSEIFPALIAGLVAKLLFRCRLVCCNTNIEFYPRPVRKLLAALHNRSDLVVTLSKDLERSLRDNGVTADMTLNPVGLDLEAIEAALEHVEDTKRYEAVFAGRHDQGKGILDLIESWAIVMRSMPEAVLVTMGIMTPEYETTIKELIGRLHIEDHVVLSGVVDEDTKFRLIKESKVCVFPSYLEGWGIVPQEALACGLPVVVYDLPVYAENIMPCGAVFAVTVGDIGSLAEQTLELLTDERYLQYEDEARGFVTRFRWDDVARAEFEALSGELR